MGDMSGERILFITGKLAEPALRKVVADLAPKAHFYAEIAVMPITVAALLTTSWIARHIQWPSGIQRVILPGFCRGELDELNAPQGVIVERGPKDLRDLPEHFGKRRAAPKDYGQFDIEILAEINHAPQRPLAEILRLAQSMRADGADVIDLGCDPGSTWSGLADAVRALRHEGMRVSIDSFNPQEVTAGLQAGAELVLSVNSSNCEQACYWSRDFPHAEFVVIPDTPSDLVNLDATVARLSEHAVRLRLDPILEPIGYGFAESLVRYHTVRQRYPQAEMMMGVGNLTELTDVDSAGVNTLLLGFCQELGIRSVLTTQVIPWCRSCVRELDLARRLVFYAVRERTLPKHVEPNLVLLRDPKVHEMGAEAIRELAQRITDRNYRIFAERGELHLLNGERHLIGDDPFDLFAEVLRSDAKMDASHAFYLGYEMAKAVTALTLGKEYRQDQALRWGFLTREEKSHRGTDG